MHKCLVIYGVSLCLLLCSSGALAQEQAHGGQWRQNNWQLSVMTGYEQETLHWSIAGNSYGQSPNVYSELAWKRTAGPSLQAAVEGRLARRWVFFARGRRMSIRQGSATDTDYRGDNRTDASYRQTFDSDKGYTASLLGGAGYLLFNNKRFTFTPFIGYSAGYQSLYLTDNNGSFGLLNSSYKTQWTGPFVRLASTLRFIPRWSLKADMVYSQLQYHATADWNLIQAFSHPVSFRQKAAGYGIDISGALQYRISPHIMIELLAGYANRQTGKGTDELYLSAGSTDKTQLNGVDADALRLLAGLHILL